MNVARHHAEWLSLVETSGPFLSMPVLLRVFPHGLDPRDSPKASSLREAYEDWLERGHRQSAVHRVWIRRVLTDLLEYRAELLLEDQAIPPGMQAVMANFGETLRPDYALRSPDPAKKPVLLIVQYPPEQDLNKPVAGKFWKAIPGTKMMELLHMVDVPLGLITNGEEWMLVYAARGETTGFASWYADLWMQEPVTLRAFQSLLHLRRLVGVAESDTLGAILAESAKDQQEVTNQLGYQVRKAVEVLIQSFDRIDAESGRKLLAGIDEQALYDAALTMMMRLVFLFSAEERGLLLLGDPLYDQHYAVSTLSELLRERADQHGEEILERRHDAWCRLLATFRAVYAGVEHEAMRLPPYGGTLFDPDRYPFLEGRVIGTQWQTTPATPLPINNRVVLHLLEALQLLRVKVPGGRAEARRLSFRALDVEQIGHVYEGLLDHTAQRAGETILGLSGSKDTEPNIPLSKLEEVAKEGAAELVDFLRDRTGRSQKALSSLLVDPPAFEEHSLLVVCGQDPLLLKRIKPFVGFLRDDSFGQPIVIPQGSVYVTIGSDRRVTGTHYTPRSLTEPIVQHTLEPLVYVGPVEGKPQGEWKLKSPREILALKVCDMTMGSGAFLVQTCRYMAERLVEAWENVEREHPGSFIVTPEGEISTGSPGERLMPADAAERLTIARRFVADRCLYGVDINPMAVEMAKLSLWLITLQRDRPFTFLDHALKCGDALLGVSSVEQIKDFSLRPGERQVTFATANLFRYVDDSSTKRRALKALPSNDHAQIETKNRLHAEAEAATAKVKALADCLIAFELRGLDGDSYEKARDAEAERVQSLIIEDTDTLFKSSVSAANHLAQHAYEQLHGRRPFHWPIEFPEIFSDSGFDAFVGNPPFMGGQKISSTYGDEYREYLVNVIGNRVRNSADLCAYIFLRAHDLADSKNGCVGLIATNTIAEGVTRRVGLSQIVLDSTIFRALTDLSWSGEAALTVSCVWFKRGQFSGHAQKNGVLVTGIDSSLVPIEHALTHAHALFSNSSLCFQGVIPLGEGFILSDSDADELLAVGPEYREVVHPYLTGKILNSATVESPKSWIISFFDWPLDRSSVPLGYSGPVASDYEKALERIERLVKPKRDSNPRKSRRVRWWQFAEKAVGLHNEIERRQLRRVIAIVMTAVHFKFDWVTASHIFDQTVVPILLDEDWSFAVLQSSLHLEWAYYHCSSFGAGAAPRYNPSLCFETFPFPNEKPAALGIAAISYHKLRDQIIRARREGLTKTYNRFHDPREKPEHIVSLRELQVKMDDVVASAYGWSDLDLGHGFHETKQGIRFTLSESARRTVLDRLLAQNHQRYEEEVKAGLHDEGAKPKKSKAEAAVVSASQTEFFG